MVYPLTLIFGPIIYLYISYSGEVTKFPKISMYPFKVGVLIYLILLSLLITSYYQSSFQRTTFIFALTCGLYMLTFFVIWFRPNPLVGLSLIACTGLAQRISTYYSSNLYNGVDIYSHNRFIEGIVEAGSLSTLIETKYFYAPFHHILSAVTTTVIDLPIRDTTVLATLSIVTVCSALIIYVTTKNYWTNRIALVASFLFISSDFAINWSVHAIPTSLGIIFFSYLLYTILKHAQRQESVYILLLVVFLSSLTFTHQASTFIAIILLSFLLFSQIAYTGFVRRGTVNIVLISSLILFVDFIVTKYSGPISDRSFFDVVAGQLIASFSGASVENRPEISLPDDPTISGTGSAGLDVLHIGGSAILICIGIIGALFWLSHKEDPYEKIIVLQLGTAVAGGFAFTMGGPIVGLNNLLPYRWFAFIYILLVIIAAPGLVYLISHRGGNSNVERYSVIIIILLVLPYVVLMGGNFKGSPDGPLFDQAPSAENHAISSTEQALFEHTANYASTTEILADRRANSILNRHYMINSNTLTVPYGEPYQISQSSAIINRSYIHTTHSLYNIRLEGEIRTVHGPFPLDEIHSENESKIYSNGEDNIVYLMK